MPNDCKSYRRQFAPCHINMRNIRRRVRRLDANVSKVRRVIFNVISEIAVYLTVDGRVTR